MAPSRDDRRVASLVRTGAERLAARGIETARLDAELLLADAAGTDRTAIIAHPESTLDDDSLAAFHAVLGRREAGEPIAYIRGFREFHGLALATDPRALIPRPETELLVDAAVDELAGRRARLPRAGGNARLEVADVGTGSGAIAVAILVALRLRGIANAVRVLATDSDPPALQLALENAVSHGVADQVELLEADLLPPRLDRRLDLVCANLPYVPTMDLDASPGLGFEPRGALDGGADGLATVRRLVDRLPGALAPGGLALLEIGAEQVPAMVGICHVRLAGWPVRVHADLSGRPRMLALRAPGRSDA